MIGLCYIYANFDILQADIVPADGIEVVLSVVTVESLRKYRKFGVLIGYDG